MSATTASVNEWLRTLGEITGMQGLALNSQGVCAFTVNDAVDVVVEAPEQGSVLHLYAPLLHLDKDDPEALFEKLLKLNYRGRQTWGATFAINQRDGDIVLCVSRPLDMLDELRFFALVDGFLGAAQHWWRELNEVESSDTDSKQDIPSRFLSTHYRV